MIEDFICKVYRERYGKTIEATWLSTIFSMAVSAFLVGGIMGALSGKVEKILKGALDLIPSPSVKIQIMGGKVCLMLKAKHCWALSTNFLLTTSTKDLPLNFSRP